MSISSDPDYLSVAQAAAVFGVTPHTIRNWIRGGRLRAYRVGPQLVRIAADDLAAVAHPVTRG